MTKETICTGDYGLSDVLIITKEALDFVDSLFEEVDLSKPIPITSIEIGEMDDVMDFPF